MVKKIEQALHVDMKADLHEICARLNGDIEAGHLVGMIAIPMYRHGHHRRYTLSLAGWASRNPTYAVGAMNVCSTLLREIAMLEAGL